MRFIRNLPLAHRLLLGFMVVALVPLVVTNELTMGVLNSSLQSQADENARSHLSELEVRLEDLLARSGETCASICSDGNISLSLIDSSGYLNTNVYLALYKASNRGGLVARRREFTIYNKLLGHKDSIMN